MKNREINGTDEIGLVTPTQIRSSVCVYACLENISNRFHYVAHYMYMQICVPKWKPNFPIQCSNVLYKVLLLDHKATTNPNIQPTAVQLLRREMEVARRKGPSVCNCAGVPLIAEDRISLDWHQ